MALKYFKLSEFDCKCCGENKMDPAVLADFDAIRGTVGFPMVPTSGYRCPKHNASVSTTGSKGPHTTGKAADFAATGSQAIAILEAALALGFTGYGVNAKGGKGFVHLDKVKRRSKVIWTY